MVGLNNVADSNSVPYVEPLILAWIVPTTSVDNVFSVTLVSNYALTGVALADFRLIQRNPTDFLDLTTSEPEIDSVSLTAVVGTNNWRIDFELNGTFDNDFQVRLVNNQALFSGMTVPAGNLNSPLFRVDSSIGVLPMVAVTSAPTTIYAGETFTATFQWDTPVTGFDVSDITVTGATVGTFNAVDADTYTLGLTADAGAGMIVVVVAENAVNENNAGHTESFTRLVYPSISITTLDTLIREDELVNFNIVFSAAVTGFTGSDITVTGGTAGTLTGSGTDYVLPVTADSGAGTIVISIAENVVSPGNAAATENFTRVAYPSITISTTDTDIREGEVVNFDIVFSAAVTGFTASDITVTGGTRGALTGSGTDYDLSVTASSGSGNIVISIPGNAVMPGNRATSATFARAGINTITISTTDTAIYETETVSFDISFPEAVTGFTASDISVTGAVRGALTGSGTTYALSVVAASGAGQIVFSIAADVVSPNNESITISFARLAYPTLGILSSIPAIYEGETFDIDFVFSAPVTGFHVSDITLTGATAGTLTGSGTTYALSVIADSGAGSIVVTVGAAAVIPGNHGATQTFTRDWRIQAL